MRVMQARELFQQLTKEYFADANVVLANQSRAAKQGQPLVVITQGNLNRPSKPNYSMTDDSIVGHYLSRLSFTVDLFTNGSPVLDPETGMTVSYEDNALEDILSYADFLNSEHTVQWCHANDVAVAIDGDAMNLTGLVNDNNYEYRARLNVLFYFTQQAVEYAAVLGEGSIVYPTGDPDNPYSPEKPVETESPTGGYETDYIKKMNESKVQPDYKPSDSGGGSEELAQERVGYFSEAEIKEEKL